MCVEQPPSDLAGSIKVIARLAIRFGVCVEASGRYFAGCEGYHVVSEEMVGTQHV